VPKEQSPEPKSRAMSTPPSDTAKDTTAPRHARVAQTWRRRLFLECGCTSDCRCDYKSNPTLKRVAAYREALEHLEREGLLPAAFTPELRELWRLGGSDRRVAETVVSGWTA
jgi:hypothetical protein